MGACKNPKHEIFAIECTGDVDQETGYLLCGEDFPMPLEPGEVGGQRARNSTVSEGRNEGSESSDDLMSTPLVPVGDQIQP